MDLEWNSSDDRYLNGGSVQRSGNKTQYVFEVEIIGRGIIGIRDHIYGGENRIRESIAD